MSARAEDMTLRFSKSFTQQEAIPDRAIEKAVDILKSGRLHRYNYLGNEPGEVDLLEQEYAAYQGTEFCLATTSCGTALQIALRALGVKAGDQVLTSAFTLAPVPGAIAAIGAQPVFVDMTDNLTLDMHDLEAKIQSHDAKVFLMSHMRGHLTDMPAICEILERHQMTMIEDCAHTMGAKWGDTNSGNFGTIGCFSTQTYKHLNSGEGGFLATNDPDIMAKAIILSGSYMLYSKHGARPDLQTFDEIRFQMPNCSSRMDNLRAAILRPQLQNLTDNVARWNARYRLFEQTLSDVSAISVPQRAAQETYVGSSFQFLLPDDWPEDAYRDFVAACYERGVELKWFGDANPVGFTSRYDSWHYATKQHLPSTLAILKRLMDIRIPLTFDLDDCEICANIIKMVAEDKN